MEGGESAAEPTASDTEWNPSSSEGACGSDGLVSSGSGRESNSTQFWSDGSTPLLSPRRRDDDEGDAWPSPGVADAGHLEGERAQAASTSGEAQPERDAGVNDFVGHILQEDIPEVMQPEPPEPTAELGSRGEAVGPPTSPVAEAESPPKDGPPSARSVASPDSVAPAVGPPAGGHARGPPRLREGWRYVEVSNGWVVYNNEGTMLNGHCGVVGHGRCHWDRTTRESRSARRAGQGRPLGALSLWFALGPECQSQQEHQQLKRWVCSRAAFGDRVRYREYLHDCANAEELFELERPKYDDTDSEPECLPV